MTASEVCINSLLGWTDDPMTALLMDEPMWLYEVQGIHYAENGSYSLCTQDVGVLLPYAAYVVLLPCFL